jgi:hypothetical protein
MNHEITEDTRFDGIDRDDPANKRMRKWCTDLIEDLKELEKMSEADKWHYSSKVPNNSKRR